jgi:hypothetical protein
MRWLEEVTLTTYEMQWTVRYFIHKSKFWSEFLNTPATPATPASDESDFVNTPLDNAGPLAYSKRKHSTWYQLALKADKIFKVINNAYKSPI